MPKTLFDEIPSQPKLVVATAQSPSALFAEAPVSTQTFALAKVDAPSSDLPALQFSKDEQAEMSRIAQQINPQNIDTVYSFGQEPSTRIANFSEQVLKTAKGNQIGEFGSQLGQVVNLARGINFQGLSDQRSKVPLIGGLIDRITQKAGDIKTSFDTVSTQIDTAVKSMDVTERNLGERIKMLDEMYTLNLEEYREFSKHLVAGQARLDELRLDLERQRSQISTNTDPMAAQQLDDFAKFVDRLDKRLHDLKVAKVMCVQTAAEIRMIQANSRDLVGQYKDIKAMTIPAWKKQFTLYLSIQEQKSAAEVAKRAKDFTNDLMAKNAEMLGQNSVAIAQGNQRALVDVSTLESVNNSLVDAFTKAQQIEQEGRARRQQEAVRLEQLSGELRDKLRAAGSRSM